MDTLDSQLSPIASRLTPPDIHDRRRMLREVLFHEEALQKETWAQPPMLPGDNAPSYAEMMRDPTVAYCLGLLQDAVLAADWSVEPAEGTALAPTRALAQAEDVRRNLLDIDLDAALRDALDALWRGFRVHEIAWRYGSALTPGPSPAGGRGEAGGRFWLESLAALDPDQIALELDDRMRVTAVLSRPGGRPEQRVPRDKVWMHVHNPSRTRPAGESLLEPAYRAWTSKNRLLQFWGLSIQRFGMTHLMVRVPANTPAAEQTAILDTLLQGRLDGIYLLKEQYTVEVMNPTQWANLTFEKSIDYQDAEIVKALLYRYTPGGAAAGQTYVTGDGLGELSRSTASRLQRISRALARSFTLDVIAPLCAANWGTRAADSPRLTLSAPDPARIATLAGPLATLVSAGIMDVEAAGEQVGVGK